MATEILTPRLPSGERIRIEVSQADGEKIFRGCVWQATVTDQRTGLRYRLRSANCGLHGCLCDTEVY
jgi:hypothetical protein